MARAHKKIETSRLIAINIEGSVVTLNGFNGACQLQKGGALLVLYTL